MEGSGPGKPQKKLDPLLISATVEASNFKFGTELRFGTSLTKKTTFKTKIGGVWARGTSQKNMGPLLISATVEANKFKCGTQIWFGTSLAKNNI